MRSKKTMSTITRTATLLAFIVVVLGAYVRLSDAGLGCPDWPGCYGKLIVPDAPVHTEEIYSARPLEHGKAWKEMIHRYAAGALGLLILYLAVVSVKQGKITGGPVILPVILVLLVIFQALLGMWTVTLLLKPVIVMVHLLGGMAILSLLFWLSLELTGDRRMIDLNNARLMPWALAGLVMAVIQISLGGWTSSNYAAMVCPDIPTCQGVWWPPMDFLEGFTFWRELGIDYEGGILALDARTAIHMTHRMGAVLSLLIIGCIAIRLIIDRNKFISRTGILLLLVLLAQFSLGIANVLLRLPLPVAVAHNATAALLLMVLVALLHQSVTPGIKRRIL
jgi:heme a synthase